MNDHFIESESHRVRSVDGSAAGSRLYDLGQFVIIGSIRCNGICRMENRLTHELSKSLYMELIGMVR